MSVPVRLAVVCPHCATTSSISTTLTNGYTPARCPACRRGFFVRIAGGAVESVRR